MAPQKKRKRSSKHRGNAAGMVEARGRTGRKSDSGGKPAQKKPSARAQAFDRLSRPPTWKSAAQRAFITALLFGVLMLLLFKRSLPQTLTLTAFMFVMYIPFGYYTDLVLYRRRQRKRK